MVIARFVIGVSEGEFSKGSCNIIAVRSIVMNINGINVVKKISSIMYLSSNPKGSNVANT